MRLICILGKSGSGKTSVENNLEKMGYNRLVSYTTRKQGKDEQNGVDYHFINKENFLKLIDKKIIMEWVEYSGEYYGSPHPIGSINNVVVVEPDGFKAIKEIYGEQVIGVYIKVDINTARERAIERKRYESKEDLHEISKRRELDTIKFKSVEEIVDLVVDGKKDVETITATILKYISTQKK